MSRKEEFMAKLSEVMQQVQVIQNHEDSWIIRFLVGGRPIYGWDVTNKTPDEREVLAEDIRRSLVDRSIELTDISRIYGLTPLYDDQEEKDE